MKIGLVSTELPGYEGHVFHGVASYTVALAERLGRRHEVTLLMRTLKTVAPGEFAGCRVEPVLVSRSRPIQAATPLFAYRLAATLSRLANDGAVEVAEGPIGYLGCYAPRRRSAAVTRLITSTYRWTHERLFDNALHGLLWRSTFIPTIRLELACLRNSDILISPGQVETDDQRRHAAFSTPVEDCPYGLDLDDCHDPARARAAIAARHGIADDRPVVLAVGRLEHRKGVDFLLKAAGAVHQHHPRAVFVVIGGDFWPGGKAALLAQTLGEAPDWVRFIGTCSDEEKRDWLAACDVVCFPSRWESFGLVLLEAMANRKPAVCFNIGGPVEIARDNPGIIAVPPFEQARLDAALIDLLADPARRSAIGEQGRRVAEERYSLDRFAARTEEIYGIALERWRGRPVRGR